MCKTVGMSFLLTMIQHTSVVEFSAYTDYPRLFFQRKFDEYVNTVLHLALVRLESGEAGNPEAKFVAQIASHCVSFEPTCRRARYC